MKLNNNIRQTFRVAKIELSSMFYSLFSCSLVGVDYFCLVDRV